MHGRRRTERIDNGVEALLEQNVAAETYAAGLRGVSERLRVGRPKHLVRAERGCELGLEIVPGQAGDFRLRQEAGEPMHRRQALESRANYQHVRLGPGVELEHRPQRTGQRFNEHRLVVGERFGHRQEVGKMFPVELRVSATSDFFLRRGSVAMAERVLAGGASRAELAAKVEAIVERAGSRDHALPDRQRAVGGGLLDHADQLVAQDHRRGLGGGSGGGDDG